MRTNTSCIDACESANTHLPTGERERQPRSQLRNLDTGGGVGRKACAHTFVRVVFIQVTAPVTYTDRFQLIVLNLDRTCDEFAAQMRALRSRSTLARSACLIPNPAAETFELVAPILILTFTLPAFIVLPAPFLYEAARHRPHFATGILLAAIGFLET